MSKKIENVVEFVSVVETLVKFLDNTNVIVKFKDNTISQHSSGKTFFYEFKSEVPDFTTYNIINLLTVIKTLTSKSADKVIYPTINIEDDFIVITTVDDGMKIPKADDSMVEHEGDYSDIYEIKNSIDLSNVIDRVVKLAKISETESVTLSISKDDIVNSIEVTNKMTKASYKKLFNKNKDGDNFDFAKNFFEILNGIKEYDTFIDIDRTDEDEMVCSLIASLPIVKEDNGDVETVVSKLYVFIENEEDIMG